MKKVVFPACMILLCLLIAVISLSEDRVWDCTNCGRTGNKGNYCGGCGQKAPETDVQREIFTDIECEMRRSGSEGNNPTFSLMFTIKGCRVIPAVESVSWTETPLHWTSVEFSEDKLQAAIHAGETVWFESGFISSFGGKRTDDYSLYVYLPDDSGIAGRQTVTLSLGGVHAIVHLTLSYSSGWSSQYLGYEYKTVRATEESEYISFDTYKVSNVCTVTLTDQDNPQLGKNQKQSAVKYVCEIPLITLLNIEDVRASWTDEMVPTAFESGIEAWFESWSSTWEAVKNGTTLYEHMTGNYFGERTIGVSIYLPNDSDIAGDQIVYLSLSNNRTLEIKLKLTWKGNYESGSGWEVKMQEYSEVETDPAMWGYDT